MSARSKYQGAAEIFNYNRGFYVSTLAAAIAGFGFSFLLPPPLRTFLAVGLTVAVLWIGVSLAVSHWVYDRSPLYSLRWMELKPDQWVNIHAGLDQMSVLLANKLPGSHHHVFDVFDKAEMTEASIERARKVSRTPASVAAHWWELPAETASLDAVFLLFAAHEFRRPEARHTFFREVARILRPDGRVILVEHLRDVWNLLAFGPGFFHFQSHATWQNAFREAGLVIARERTLTPFVRVFELRPQ